MNKRNFVAAALALLLAVASSRAGADFISWKTYSSFSDVRQATSDSRGRLWAATSGGVYVYEESGNFIPIRRSAGLIRSDIRAIGFSREEGKIYMGAADGFLQIADEDLRISYADDIYSSSYPDKEIRDFDFYGGFVFVSGGFGLAKFDPKRGVFLESTNRFSLSEGETKAFKSIAINGVLYAATPKGIFKIDAKKSIANPENWELVASDADLGEREKIVDIDSLDGRLVFASSSRIFALNGGEFSEIYKYDSWSRVLGIENYRGEIVFADEGGVYRLDGSPLANDFFGKKIRDANKTILNGVEKLAVIYDDAGASLLSGDGENVYLKPNSPASNNFMDMSVASDGTLWVATESPDAPDGKGFESMTREGVWTNYNYFENSAIDNHVKKIEVGPNGEIVASSWGNGLYILEKKGDSLEIKNYDEKNSPLTSAISKSDDYVVTGRSKFDEDGNLWILNYGEGTSGPLLVVLGKDGKFRKFYNKKDLNEREYLEMTIDRQGTKWLCSNSREKGMAYFNENGTLDDESDDVFGVLLESNSGLISNEQTCVVEDRNGFLWIGTRRGLNYIYDPASVLRGEKPSVREDPYFRNQIIYDIYVDPLNQKWIATSQGVWIVNSDGSELVDKKILNSRNVPLPDDAVYSITSDPETGVFYFGTKKGLAAAKTAITKPAEKYDIKCYPQPFEPKKDGFAIIEGLAANSEVRIVAADGSLTRKISAAGGRVRWDGRDEFGEIVPTGVYFVFAISAADGKGGAGKIAVVNGR